MGYGRNIIGRGRTSCSVYTKSNNIIANSERNTVQKYINRTCRVKGHFYFMCSVNLRGKQCRPLGNDNEHCDYYKSHFDLSLL